MWLLYCARCKLWYLVAAATWWLLGCCSWFACLRHPPSPESNLMCALVDLCSKFIGQGEGRRGEKGMAQSEQQEVLRAFREGACNVLLATCIGEEGLDIPQVRVGVWGNPQ